MIDVGPHSMIHCCYSLEKVGLKEGEKEDMLDI